MYRGRVYLGIVALTSLLALGSQRPAHAQGAAAFVPVIGSFPDGVQMNAVPVVSADRRYVRLTMNTQFTSLQSFTTVEIPLAVGGGGIGGFGGFGGGGGGGGGAGGGAGGGGGVGGGRIAAGMDGIIGPAGGPMIAQGPMVAFQGPFGGQNAAAAVAGINGRAPAPMLSEGMPIPVQPRRGFASRGVKKARKPAKNTAAPK